MLGGPLFYYEPLEGVVEAVYDEVVITTFKREVLGPTLSRAQALTVLRWLNSLSKDDYVKLGSLWEERFGLSP